MSLKNFTPTIWSKDILVANRRSIVVAQKGVINHDYEGDVSGRGDSVKINGLEPVTVGDYDRVNGLGAPQVLDSNQTTLVIDQQKKFDFLVDDIDKAQNDPQVLSAATEDAGYRLALTQDNYVLSTMVAGVDAGNKLANLTGASSLGDNKEFYDRVLIPLRTKLNKAEVNPLGRFALIDADAEAMLLLDPRFIAADPDKILFNGLIGRAAGFNILVTNAPVITGKTVAGIGNATTVADQIVKTRGIESENWFGTRVQGLHVYGAKVIRPKNLASAIFTKA